MKVTINGTPGLHFSGLAGTRSDVDNGTERELDGVTPMTFSADARAERYGATGWFYAIVVTRDTPGPGTLSVTLTCPDGDHTDSTSEEFGTATTSCAGK